MANVSEPLVAARQETLRAAQRVRRRQFRDAARAARDARLRIRRTKISDPPEILLAVRQEYDAAQEAVDAATSGLHEVQRQLHDVSLKLLTASKVGHG